MGTQLSKVTARFGDHFVTEMEGVRVYFVTEMEGVRDHFITEGEARGQGQINERYSQD